MVAQLVVKHTFWDVEVKPEEFAVEVQSRSRAYSEADMCRFGGECHLEEVDSPCSKIRSSRCSTAEGSSIASSQGSEAGDLTERVADFSEEDTIQGENLPHKPAGTWLPIAPVPVGRMGSLMGPMMVLCYTPAPSHVNATMPLESQGAVAREEARVRSANEAKGSKRSKGKAAKRAPVTRPACQKRTTLVLRKLPSDYTRAALLQTLDSAGFKGLYDFAYLPTDFKRGKVFGYALINFTAQVHAEDALARFGDANVSGTGSPMSWSDSHQGLEELIQRYRDSPVMAMPEEYQPILLRDGMQIPFPEPQSK